MKNRTLCSRLTACFLAVLLSASLLPVPASAAGTAHFTDVSSGHWAYSFVERAYGDGAIVGTGGDPAKGTGVFSPDTEMTYGQFVTMMMSAFYPDELAKASPKTPWYAPAIQVAVDRELTFITQERLTSLANSNINRYNMAWILMKVLEDKGGAVPTSQERTQAAARIGDWETVQATASGAWNNCVSGVVAAGLISGVDDKGTFNGTGRVTRAAAAVIYTQLADKLSTGQSSGQNAGQSTGQTGSTAQQEPIQITYGEGWNLITVPGYRDDLEKAFYETYPRLLARWGTETTQRIIPVAVKQELNITEDSNAFMWATYSDFNWETKLWKRTIEIAAAEQKTRGSWAFTHELTHVVQTYYNFESSWWEESMASYGHFRYASWADPYFFEMKYYFPTKDTTQRDWNFTAYGGQWFFAYLDERYPTTPKGYGLIDAIHFGIKAGKIGSDDINDPDLNAVVKQITGFNTIDQLRRKFVQELDAGSWSFQGFAGYADNYITENLPGVPNPVYLTPETVNLCAGAYTYSGSGAAANGAADNLVDGNRTTKWQAAPKDVTDRNLSQGVQHSLCVSLYKAVTIDTYSLWHAGSQGDSQQNTVSWRLWYYDDSAKKWKKLDDVTGNTEDVTTRSVTPVTTKNLWLEVLNSSGTGDSTVRLYELELYSKK